MFELRWLVEPTTTTKPPVLQYRYARSTSYDPIDGTSLAYFSDWEAVPTEVAATPGDEQT